MLRCGDGSLYTGVARDIARRLVLHRSGRASRYTRSHLPVRLVFLHRARSWSHALRRESRIKALTRAQKESLLRAGRERTRALSRLAGCHGARRDGSG
jgi:putative endonuclease